jgi:pimeloyl-ACP methyl ester carboxylesterase
LVHPATEEVKIGRLLRRTGIAVVTVAALYFIVGGIGGGLFLSWLLTPGNVDWSGANKPAPDDPLTIGYRGDPMQALGLAFQTIHYETELGPAEAWLVPAAEPTTTWAVFVHGVGGIRENGYRQLSMLHEAGITTLLITYRNDKGAPKSTPPLFSFGLTEWRDLDAAIGWMLGNGAGRVVLVAESMGGAIAGQFLEHSDRTGSIVALALDAPALDMPASVARLAEFAHVPLADWLAPIVVRVAATATGAALTDAVVIDAVAAFPGPLFVAHGSADPLVPISLSKRLVAMRGDRPTTFLWTGADHLHSYAEEPEEYRAKFLEFLRGI